MTQYRVSDAADIDMDDQAVFLASQAGDELAYRFLGAATRTFEFIARMPGIGEIQKLTNSRLSGLRAWKIDGFANHLVFYQPTEDGIEIVRVLHALSDFIATLEAYKG